MKMATQVSRMRLGGRGSRPAADRASVSCGGSAGASPAQTLFDNSSHRRRHDACRAAQRLARLLRRLTFRANSKTRSTKSAQSARRPSRFPASNARSTNSWPPTFAPRLLGPPESRAKSKSPKCNARPMGSGAFCYAKDRLVGRIGRGKGLPPPPDAPLPSRQKRQNAATPLP